MSGSSAGGGTLTWKAGAAWSIFTLAVAAIWLEQSASSSCCGVSLIHELQSGRRILYNPGAVARLGCRVLGGHQVFTVGVEKPMASRASACCVSSQLGAR